MASILAVSIRAKLFAIIMITTASALVIAAISMTVFEFKTYREALARELSTVANIIGLNSTAALEFTDARTAEEILAAAGSLPEVISACLYDRENELFASYVRPGRTERCPARPDAGVARRRDGFVVQELVTMRGERIGTLRLFSHVGELQRRVNMHMLILFIVLLVSALVALLMSARLQRIVSVPIRDLARTAKNISEKHDYALRAEKHSADEIGAAVDAFNQMLDRIEHADAAIRQAGDLSRKHARILQSVLDSMGEGMAVTNSEGAFLIWNPAATRILGKGPVETAVETWPSHYGLYRPGGRDLYPPEELPLARAMRGELVNDTEIYLRPGADEPARWISATARPFRDDEGNLRGGIVVFRDVSERKAADEEVRALNATLERRIAERTAALEERASELKRSNEELEAFAYVASHDLQEPLRAMASYAQLLKRQLGGKMSEDADLYLDHVLEGATRLRALINALLDYSRVGRRPLERRAVPLEAVFDAALVDLGASIAESGARVTRGPLPVLAADPVQLGQLFRNLITNAIKFRSSAPPVVEVSAEVSEDQWRFTVRDNGIGIDPKYHDRIFVIFQRLHGRERAGTGIGLAVCKKIVERHGGQIWVESSVGQGAAFRFTLPIRGQIPRTGGGGRRGLMRASRRQNAGRRRSTAPGPSG